MLDFFKFLFCEVFLLPKWFCITLTIVLVCFLFCFLFTSYIHTLSTYFFSFLIANPDVKHQFKDFLFSVVRP